MVYLQTVSIWQCTRFETAGQICLLRRQAGLEPFLIVLEYDGKEAGLTSAPAGVYYATPYQLIVWADASPGEAVVDSPA